MPSSSPAGSVLSELQRTAEWMTEQQERRAVYRVGRTEAAPPELTLLVGTLRLPVFLLDVSAAGASVVVAAADVPRLRAATVGSAPEWSLLVSGDGVAKPLRVPARPVAVQPWGGGARLALSFTITPHQRSALDAGLRAIFNQRRAVRVDADPESPVALAVEALGAPWRTRGLLRDASVSGLGLLVPERGKVALAPGDWLRIRLNLPEEVEQAVIIGMCVRASRVELPAGAAFPAVFQVGVDLDPNAADGGRASMALGRYVVRRQVAERRRTCAH